MCKDGFWSLDGDSEIGCQPCDCSELGALSQVCDKSSGQCHCNALLTGRRCDQVEEAAFIPTLDGHVIEGESGMSSNDTNTSIVASYDGANITGTGTILVSGPGMVFWHDITVPRSGPYIVVLRTKLHGQVFWQLAQLVFEHVSGVGDPPDRSLCDEPVSGVTLNFDRPQVGSSVAQRVSL